MPEQVDVYYDGWGEHWRWGTLVSSNAITGRPLIAFEYSDEARRRGLELSAYTLALNGPKLHKDFPAHQMLCRHQAIASLFQAITKIT